MRIDEDLKMQLARELCAITEGWSQYEAAALLQLRQPEVSMLRAGRLARFSVSRLVRLVASRGYHIELTLRPAMAPRETLRQTPTVTVVRTTQPRSNK